VAEELTVEYIEECARKRLQNAGYQWMGIKLEDTIEWRAAQMIRAARETTAPAAVRCTSCDRRESGTSLKRFEEANGPGSSSWLCPLHAARLADRERMLLREKSTWLADIKADSGVGCRLVKVHSRRWLWTVFRSGNSVGGTAQSLLAALRQCQTRLRRPANAVSR